MATTKLPLAPNAMDCLAPQQPCPGEPIAGLGQAVVASPPATAITSPCLPGAVPPLVALRPATC